MPRVNSPRPILGKPCSLTKNAVTRLERRKVDSRTSILAAIEKALVKAGIEFLPSDTRGEGVRLRSPKA